MVAVLPAGDIDVFPFDIPALCVCESSKLAELVLIVLFISRGAAVDIAMAIPKSTDEVGIFVTLTVVFVTTKAIAKSLKMGAG